MTRSGQDRSRIVYIGAERVGCYFFHDNTDEALVSSGGHLEIPSSGFPIPPALKLLSKTHSPFGGGADR